MINNRAKSYRAGDYHDDDNENDDDDNGSLRQHVTTVGT